MKIILLVLLFANNLFAQTDTQTLEQKKVLFNEFKEVSLMTFHSSGNLEKISGKLFSFNLENTNKSLKDHTHLLRDLLALNDKAKLKIMSQNIDKKKVSYIRLSLEIDNLPVKNGLIILHVKDNTVIEIHNNIPPSQNINSTQRYDALSSLDNYLRLKKGIYDYEVTKAPELGYIIDLENNISLAWNIQVCIEPGRRTCDGGGIIIIIDPTNGNHIYSVPGYQTWITNVVLHNSSVSGTVIPFGTGNSNAFDTRKNMETAGSYFDNVHGRATYYDDTTLVNVLHVGVHAVIGGTANQAAWIPSQNGWLFGDGDGVNFSSLGVALDVAAHEYTHAVTQHTAGLVYANESGALNEAMSDIFAAAVEDHVFYWPTAPNEKWLIGEAVYTPGINGDALRYMDDPTQDFVSRDFYPSRYIGSQDFGGVHWNSGIANLAFYLASEGGGHPRGVTTNNVYGIGIDNAAKVFYGALHHRLLSTDGFAQAREKTAQEALALGGTAWKDAVCGAWDAVGVPGANAGSCTPTGAVPGTISGIGYLSSNWYFHSGEITATHYESWTSNNSTTGFTLSDTRTDLWFMIPQLQYGKIRACNSAGCGPFSITIFNSN